MKLKTRKWLSCLIAAMLLAGCGGDNESGPQGGQMNAPVVTVATPLEATITLWEEYTGRLEATESVQIRPRVSGYIESIHFTEGQEVQSGDLLYVIDPRPFEAVVSQATAAVQQSEAAKSLADANLKRAEQLIADNAIAREEADIRSSEALQAAADLEAARASLRRAELDLEFTRVTAPITGIAGRRLVTKGNLVSGEIASASTVLTSIVPHDPIYAIFEIDERAFLRGVRRFFEGKSPGRGGEPIPVELNLVDETDFPHKGIVDFVDNQLDPNSATMLVRGLFENDNKLLTPGQFARVRVAAGDPKTYFLLPDRALVTDQNLTFVWAIQDDGTVNRKVIRPGPLYQGLRVVFDGLSSADQVVIEGGMLLQPGIPVQTKSGTIALPETAETNPS